MKPALKWSLLACLISIGIHIYSTINYYPVKLGFAKGESACNINEQFNCDAVTASQYSDFLGVPMSVWGAMTHLTLFFALLVVFMSFTEYRNKWLRLSLVVSGFIALISVLMGSIAAVAIGTLCINCMGSYVMSFVLLLLVYKSQEEPFLKNFKNDLGQLASGYWKDLLIVFGSILAGGFIIHKGAVSNYGLPDNFDKIVENSILSWKSNPVQEFDMPGALEKGLASSNIIVTEFADFLCPHCKMAATSMKPLIQAHKNRVKLKFYSFPLDGTCNEAVGSGGDGKRCMLSSGVYCAGKQGKGWEVHDQIFADQSDFRSKSTATTEEYLTSHAEKLGIKVSEFLSCLNAPETLETLKKHADLGKVAGVKGTPTIFVNGKHLPGGQMMPILQKALREALKK